MMYLVMNMSVEDAEIIVEHQFDVISHYMYKAIPITSLKHLPNTFNMIRSKICDVDYSV